nr:hypothetical protein [Tanacetum cinerariifolium]
MKWVPKLMGFDYEVVYKKGKDNAAAGALSRRQDVSEFFALSTTFVSIDLYQRIVSSWSEDEQLHAFITNLKKGEVKKHYVVHNNNLLREIWCKNLKEHVTHLIAVLSKMRDHSLYAKESTCVFGTTHVEYLGHVISAAPVLALPNFNKLFIVEKNASGVGLGVVLQQNGHPIAYMSKALAPKHQPLLTYENEFLAVLMALDKWRGYLLDRYIVIKIDHYSLKYLLDYKITTPTQMKWVPKLMGFDYEVVYKKGKDNAATGALSRRQDVSEFFALSTTFVSIDLYQRIVSSWSEDEQLHAFITNLKKGEVKKHYVV